MDWIQWWNIKILGKSLKNSAKNKKWNYSSLWVSLRHTKPDETGKLSLICHSMCYSMRHTKPHEDGLYEGLEPIYYFNIFTFTYLIGGVVNSWVYKGVQTCGNQDRSDKT